MKFSFFILFYYFFFLSLTAQIITTNYSIPDFQVNENVGYDYPYQYLPDIASDSNGNFTIAWMDLRNKMDNIYFQQFSSDGSAIKENINVTENNSNDIGIDIPQIAMTKVGNFIITFIKSFRNEIQLVTNQYTPKGELIDVKTENIINERIFYEPALTAWGENNFLISRIGYYNDSLTILVEKITEDKRSLIAQIPLADTSENKNVDKISISCNDEGQFVLAWFLFTPSGEEFFCKLFDKNGKEVSKKIEITDENHNYVSPEISVSMDKMGGFVVVWKEYRVAATQSIFAQMFNASGEKNGNNILVANLNSDMHMSSINVLHRSNDNYVITWKDSEGYQQDKQIYYKEYSKTGDEISNNSVFLSEQDSTTFYDVNTLMTENNFVICWHNEQYKYGFTNNNINCMVLTPEYVIGKNTFIVNDNDESPRSEQSYPEIAVNLEGDFVITWLDKRNFYKDEIYAQLINKDGNFIGSNIKIPLDNPQSHQVFFPKVVYNKNQYFLVAWVTNTGQIRSINGQIYSQTGKRIGNNIVISEKLNSWVDNIHLVSDINGNFNIVWEDRIDNPNFLQKIFMKQFSESGELLRDKFIINDDSVYIHQWSPSISSLSNGNFIASWIAADGDTVSGNPTVVAAQILSPSGERIGNTIIVDRSEENKFVFNPISAASPDTSFFLIGWNKGDYINENQFFMKKFSNEGEIIIESVLINNDNPSYWSSPKISISSQEKTLVTFYGEYYAKNNNYWVYKLSTDLNLIDEPFRVVNISSTDQMLHKSVLSEDKIYNTWVDSRTGDNDDDIWANVLDWNNVTDILDENENNQIPLTLILHQNYPNPFNPSTTIKYSLPLEVKSEKLKVKNVILKVYDILGREVATLVNQKQKSGNYEINWNASSHPNGIYFYQLVINNTTETKKMILLK